MNGSIGLYVHMPWCVRKCPYCDFNSHQMKSARPDAGYIDALLRDLDRDGDLSAGRRIDTVFFGGGTPSLFPPEDFARLLESLRRRLEFAADAEITLEANPGTIERGRFLGYREAGINRVSLGAQTFSPVALATLGRIHSADDTHRAVEELRAADLGNFNIDLMFALPGQSHEEAVADVQTAIAAGPAHISYYQLTLEPGTVFHARPPVLPDEDSAWLIQESGQALLAAAGYEQYEVSAYARDGFRCRHNLNYWRFGDYLGIGAGAHGKVSLALPGGVMRTLKPKQPRDYLEQTAGGVAAAGRSADGQFVVAPPGGGSTAGDLWVGERRSVAAADLPFEFMLNALRLNEGFAAARFEASTGLPGTVYAGPMERCRARGLIEPIPGGWMPTELGRRFLNDLQASFLA